MSSWYKRERDGTVFYCLSPQYKDKYFIAPSSDASELKDFIETLAEKEGFKTEDIDIRTFNDTVPTLLASNIPVKEQMTELPAGQYYYAHGGPFTPDRLVVHNFRKDRYLDVFNKSNEIINQVNNFLKSESIYRSIDEHMVYKFGVLLYGPPGEGKTSLIRHLVNTNEAFKDAIVITINDDMPHISFLQTLNRTTKGRLKVFIFEEITNFTQTARQIEQILTFLDGESSIDKSISFATTNYPELLPHNIVERPSRIDKLYKISSPNDEERKRLLNYFSGVEPSEDEIKLTTGYSSAFLKEICINARRNQISLANSLVQVKENFDTVKRDFKENKLGF